MMPLVSGFLARSAQVSAGQPRLRQRGGQSHHHYVPPQTVRLFWQWRLSARRRCPLRLVRAPPPKSLDVVGNHVEIGLTPVWVDAHDILAAVGQTDLVEARSRQPERLRRGGLPQRKRTAAVRIDDFDAKRLCLVMLLGGSQLEKRVDQARAAVPLCAGEIAGGLLHEGDERRT